MGDDVAAPDLDVLEAPDFGTGDFALEADLGGLEGPEEGLSLAPPTLLPTGAEEGPAPSLAEELEPSLAEELADMVEDPFLPEPSLEALPPLDEAECLPEPDFEGLPEPSLDDGAVVAIPPLDSRALPVPFGGLPEPSLEEAVLVEPSLEEPSLEEPALEEPALPGEGLVAITRYLGSDDSPPASAPALTPGTPPSASAQAAASPQATKRIAMDPQAPTALAQGLLASYAAPLAALDQRLCELSESQKKLLDAIRAEHEQFSKFPAEVEQVAAIFKRIPEYQAKIVQLQKNMQLLSSIADRGKAKSSALLNKKRADEQDARQRQRQQRDREKMLLAKPAPDLNA